MRSFAIALLGICVAAAPLAARAAGCTLHQGDHVVLASTADDPDVLVWDSRLRLRDYSAASFDEAKLLTPHALLVPPGTRAIVESCVAGFVQSPLFSVPGDAVGVKIVTGAQHGHIGWVLGSDVRALRNAQPANHFGPRAKTRSRPPSSSTRSISTS